MDKLLISSDQCDKLIAQGATGYLLLYTAVETELQKQSNPLLAEDIQALLQSFQDIFAAPTGLPPVREIDHQIPLKADAKPPNIRPYRMSHSQKDTMEKIIKEMIQKREIRISKSPYSSPYF
jgi:hypothetical protein